MNRENAHLYLPLIQALADGKQIQHSYNPKDANPQWLERQDIHFTDPPEFYRVKPNTIRIGAYDVPEPLRVAPAIGTSYYAPRLYDSRALTHLWRWQNDSTDNNALAMGFVHVTQEAAEIHARALISLTQTPTQPDNE